MKSQDSSNLRKSAQTELNVLRYIYESPAISRVELAPQSGLSTGAMTGIVTSLLNRGLIVEDSTIPSPSQGRRRVGLTLNPTLGYVVGVDLGTFNLRICVTDLSGRVLVVHQTPTAMERGRAEVLSRCFMLIRQKLDENNIPASLLRGIGIAFSGVMDTRNGVILSYPRPGQVEFWRNVPLRALVEEEFGVTCIVEDSVRSIATSEKSSGAGRNFSDFVYVDVGMGVGSAVFISNKLYRGANGNAGEFGHITIDEDGPLCCCGSHGCLEAFASGSVIIEKVRSALTRGVVSQILDMVNNDLDKISLEIIATAAERNDSLSYRTLIEAATHIGAASADLVNLLNPESIIYGGALFRAAPSLMLDHIKRLVRHRAMEKAANDVVLLLAETSGDAGARGMARLIGESILEQIFREKEPDRQSDSSSALR
jgi:predicted NBD/HSP70 family sugar kinase